MKSPKPSLLLITGWAHGPEAVQPVADVLSNDFDVRILTGTQVLSKRYIPPVKCIVTGSMGGLLAMEMLPTSCQQLVLISSTAKFCATDGYPCGTPERVVRRMIEQLKRDPETVLDEFFKNVHFPRKESRRSILLRRENMVGLTDGTKQDASSTLNELVCGLEYLLHSDVRDLVPSIEIPVLLLHGTEDRIIPLSAGEWLHSHLPDSRLKTIENDGHALPAHHFDTVMKSIQAFLKK